MIKWKEIAGPSCLTSADINEPIFTLRANDELAPQTVRSWAAHYLMAKGSNITQRQVAKFDEALELANQMEEWRSARDAG